MKLQILYLNTMLRDILTLENFIRSTNVIKPGNAKVELAIR